MPDSLSDLTQRGFFPILPWSALRGFEAPYQDARHGLESIAECGFTVAGFIQPRDLAACEALGLKAIVAPPRRPRYMGEEWSGLVERGELDERVRAWVAEVEATPGAEAVMGYFVMDEPGASMFQVLGRVVEALGRHAPEKMAYINLYPNYATINTFDESGQAQRSQLQTASYAEHLERYVAEVRPQFLSYDNYMVLYADDLQDDEKSTLYFGNLLDVRRVALASGLPWWQVVSSNQIRPRTPVPSAANLSLQAYTTLAAGGKGVGWFTYYGLGYGYAPIDRETGLKTATWYALRAVNEQLRVIGPLVNRLRSTGVYCSEAMFGLAPLPGRAVRAIEATAPVMVGEFVDDGGGEYAMVVNLGLERSVKVFVTPVTEGTTAEIASVDDGGFRAIDLAAGVWLTAGQGVLLRLLGT